MCLSNGNFNPQGSREPRLSSLDSAFETPENFNPQGSREPRLGELPAGAGKGFISIHKALASLDWESNTFPALRQDFNPQGSREPRLLAT